MKKIIICFVILLSLMLTCCAKQQKEYKVTIYDIDGNIYQELSSIDFVVPKMPEVTGYQFKEFQEAIPNEITKDLELHPIYEPIMHKVSFMSGDGSLFLEVDVRDGEKVTIPSAVPTNELWAFDGWDFDFDTVIKEDTRIRGIWHQVKYSIKFYVNDKIVKEVIVEEGATVPMLEDGIYDGVFAVFSIYGKEIKNITGGNLSFIGKTENFNTIELYDKYNNLVYSGIEYDPVVLKYLEEEIEVPYYTFNGWREMERDTINNIVKYEASYTITKDTLDKNSSAYWIRRNAGTYDVRKVLLTLDEIEKINENNIFGAYDKTKAVDVKKIESTIAGIKLKSLINDYSNINKYTVYNENGSVHNDTSDILNNRNLNAISGIDTVKFGIITDFARLRSYPTNCYSKNKDSDQFQETSLNVGEPVAIYYTSLDGEWYFVQATNYNGWIETKNVGLCSKDVMLTFLNDENKAVIIANYIDIAGHHVRMGQAFPIKRMDGDNPVILFPIRLSNGNLDFASQKLTNASDYSIGYLPYTIENILIQGFKILGMSYSWGDKYETGRDCSSTQNGVLACFGFKMPRNTSNQRSIPTYSKVLSGLTPTQIKEYRPGTLIFSSGHVMMYIGIDENSNPYILHNTTGGGANRCITQNFSEYSNKIIASLTLQK